MPNRWAVANGNWSNPATWSGSLIPTASDDVFANNFTVNVDTSFQVLSLRNTASASAVVAGGSFNFNSGSISGSMTSLSGIVMGANNLITVTATTGIVTISAPLTNIIGINTTSTQVINYTGNCDLIVTASSLNAAAANNTPSINKTSTGTLTVIGNVIGTTWSAAASVPGAIVSSAGNTIVIGNVIGSLTVAIGGIASCGITQTAGSLTVVGTLFGGSILSTNSAVNFSGTSLTVNGTVIGGGGTGGAPGITVSSAATVNISGSMIAGVAPAVLSTNLSATNIFTGPLINNNAVMAVQCARMFMPNTPTQWQFQTDAIGTSQTLYTADWPTTYPSASNVRLGTVYSGSLVGTLVMPTASSVQFGVPVGNTTGSTVLTTASLATTIWERPRTQLTGSGTIGNRLQNAVTPATVGNQIASYLL